MVGMLLAIKDAFDCCYSATERFDVIKLRYTRKTCGSCYTLATYRANLFLKWIFISRITGEIDSQ